MAIARVTAQDSGGTGTTATFPGTPTAGDVMLIDVYANLAPGSVSLPAGWSMLGVEAACGGSAANGAVSTWVKAAGASEPTTVAITTAATTVRWLTSEYSGVSTTGDGASAGANSATTTVTTQNTGSLTTTNANDLLHAVYGFSGNTTNTFSVDSSFTVLPQSIVRLAAAERIVSSTGTFNPALTWTTVMRAGGVVVSLQASSGSSAASGGTASLSLSASGTDASPASGTASLSLSASGTDAAPETGSGSLTLAAAGTDAAPAGGTAALSLGASGTDAARGSGTGALTLTLAGTVAARAGGTATLILAAVGDLTIVVSAVTLRIVSTAVQIPRATGTVGILTATGEVRTPLATGVIA